jgi:hypothetical protein
VFSPSAQKIQVSSTAKQFVHGWKGKNILQGMDKYTQYCLILITIFCKDNANIPKLCTGRLKEKLHLSNLRNVLWFINLRHRYPTDKQWYKVKVIIRIKASNRYKFRTSLSRFRVSSPANSRPPLAQI